jgi:hypothetical protein
MQMKIKLQAASRLAAHDFSTSVFAATDTDAGKVLTELKKALGTAFVRDDRSDKEQTIMWRAADWSATLTLDLMDDTLDFYFGAPKAQWAINLVSDTAKGMVDSIKTAAKRELPVKLDVVEDLRKKLAKIKL